MIVNRQAGKRGVRRDADRAAARLRERGVDVQLEATGSAQEARTIIAQARSEVRCVVAVGGDGTLRGVVDSAAGEVPVGLIPRGTANVVARELGIPLDPTGAADLLADGTPRRLDLGRIEGRGTFMAMVGVGFDAAVVEDVRPGRWKALRMGISAVRQFVSPNLPELAITVDGAPVEGPAFATVIANTRNYGGWFAACPDAVPDDGRLDTMTLLRRDRRALARAGFAIVRKRPGNEGFTRYGKAETVEIDTTDGSRAPVQADGDPCGTTPIRISIAPGAVAIIAPGGRPS